MAHLFAQPGDTVTAGFIAATRPSTRPSTAQPGMYEPTGRCLTCDSRHCGAVCLNGDALVDDTPETDPLAFLSE